MARVAGHLVALGVEAGDRVGLQDEKSVAGVVIYLATLMAGAVFVPLNAAYTPAEVDYFVKDARPKLEPPDFDRAHACKPRPTRSMRPMPCTLTTDAPVNASRIRAPIPNGAFSA